jgi:hypothetical protein
MQDLVEGTGAVEAENPGAPENVGIVVAPVCRCPLLGGETELDLISIPGENQRR